jgi:hypothetical protein
MSVSLNHKPGMKPETAASSALEAIEDRPAGSLLGLAAGDAAGKTLEFKLAHRPLTAIIGSGPFSVEGGDRKACYFAVSAFIRSAVMREREPAALYTDVRTCTGGCLPPQRNSLRVFLRKR